MIINKNGNNATMILRYRPEYGGGPILILGMMLAPRDKRVFTMLSRPQNAAIIKAVSPPWGSLMSMSVPLAIIFLTRYSLPSEAALCAVE